MEDALIFEPFFVSKTQFLGQKLKRILFNLQENGKHTQALKKSN